MDDTMNNGRFRALQALSYLDLVNERENKPYALRLVSMLIRTMEIHIFE